MNNKIPEKVILRIEQLGNTTDKLGTPVDNKIKLIVATLQALGFITTASCAGHSDGRTPWVDISSQIGTGFLNSKTFSNLLDKIEKCPTRIELQREYNELCKEPCLANVREGVKLLELLNKFYKVRSQDEDIRLVLEVTGWQGLGGIRIRSQGDQFVVLKNEQDKGIWLKQSRDEMNEFAKFLFSEIP